MIQTDRKTYIHWKTNNSNYAHANRKQIVEINRILGSSLTSVSKMLANGEEQKSIMKDIISISPTSPNWDKILADYWNSLRVEIPEVGKELQIGFIYDINAPDKLSFINRINNDIKDDKKKLTTDESLRKWIDDKIDMVFFKFNKDLKDINKLTDEILRDKKLSTLYKNKWDNISLIENERYKVGRPVNSFDYMIYKYCLGFSQVANEIILIDKSSNIKFYLHSLEDIKKEESYKLEIERKMMSKYLEIGQNVEAIENVLYAMGKGTMIPKSDSDKPSVLLTIAKENPERFVNVASRKDLALTGLIEKLITKSILTRFPGSGIIVDSADTQKVIGNNLNEVISYLSSDKNKGELSELKLRLKNLPD